MGAIFRKALNFGLFRLNLSKSGFGSSWGIPGIRMGISADGRKYLRISLPGTGIGWVKYLK